MFRRVLLISMLALSLGSLEPDTWVSPAIGQTPGDLPRARVGVVIDGPGELNAPVLKLVHEAVLDLTEGEFTVEFPENKTITADWSSRAINETLDQLLIDPEVDIVLAMGVVASHEAVRRESLPKPTIAPFIVNYGLELAPMEAGTSGVSNLTFIVQPRTFERDVVTFGEIAPFDRLALLVNRHFVEAFPPLLTNAESILTRMGIDFQSVLVGDDVFAAVEAIEADVDAVYVMPQIHLPSTAMADLAQQLIARRLPSFSMMGRNDVEKGILAGLNPDILPRLSRRIALTVQSILLGDPAADLPVTFAPGERLTVNVATMEAIDVSIGWGTLTEADTVGEVRRNEQRRVSLSNAVEEALRVNRDLLAKEREVAAAAGDVGVSRSRLLPQVDLLGLGTLIDEDRAATSFGAFPEQTLSGSATLSQLLYSEKAWADLSIQSKILGSLEADLDAVRMDVAREAATAYLQVLRASAIEQIQKDNLQMTRSNLELAQVRELIGQAGPAEVIRFESQLAGNVRAAIDANAARNLAEIELNRVLNRPLEESFETAERNLDDARGQLDEVDLSDYIQTKKGFSLFRDFMVEAALSRSPELLALDRAIAAAERARRSTGNAFWQPNLSFEGDISHRFAAGGAGTDPISPELSFDDTEWSLALALSFPLFEGGAKFALRGQASEEVARLRHEREAVALLVSQRTRVALHLMGASFAGIEQSARAKSAAERTLALVIDSYAQGAVSILDLLDAQTNALIEQQQEAAAVYDFFIDLIEVYRSVGSVLTMFDPQENEQFLQRVDAFFASHGLTPRPAP